MKLTRQQKEYFRVLNSRIRWTGEHARYFQALHLREGIRWASRGER